MKKRFWSVLTVAVMMAVLITTAAYAEQAENDSASAELSQEEIDVLMAQVAESEVAKSYEEYLPDEAFACSEIFGIDREGDEGTAYTHLNTAEYVVLKEKAYLQSGSLGEAIIQFKYTENGPELTEVIWSEDGAGHDEWLEENFPEEYLKKSIEYNAFDEDGSSKLDEVLIPEVEKVLGVPVETENLLTIDAENGTYEIIKVIETFEPEYKFETETIETGDLSDLKD